MFHSALIILSLFITVIGFYFLRQGRLKSLKARLINKFENKLNTELENAHPKNSFKFKIETQLDAITVIGGSLLSFFEHLQFSKFINDDLDDSIKENLVFQSMQRRHENFDDEEILNLFQQKLNANELNQIKGDLGEEIISKSRIEDGFEVEFPQNIDGSWKSNQEGYDFVSSKDGISIKDNPKVGYENNFSKLKEEALENPDSHYIVSPDHEESIARAGISNMTTSKDLESESIHTHIEDLDQLSKARDGFESGVAFEEASEAILDDLSSTVPWLSLAFSGVSHAKLVHKGDMGYGEAITSTLAKTATKTAMLQSGGYLGAQIGMVGGPIGMLIGGIVGSLGGAMFGGALYVAWKSNEMFKMSVRTVSCLT